MNAVASRQSDGTIAVIPVPSAAKDAGDMICERNSARTAASGSDSRTMTAPSPAVVQVIGTSANGPGLARAIFGALTPLWRSLRRHR
ncbi:hypothetical protein KO516_11545 [Citreicella sp. C3M06]|uniref:hypothetical protein n=1 Tax=Citreicella sp. C3M06 TaxID=2841564 RepID=UPI001C09C482|nr:hypothetical protein [Citreicella sp. C3M06]MBU2961442.1 hypothetical protein [Citreicella sp. C3M06]